LTRVLGGDSLFWVCDFPGPVLSPGSVLTLHEEGCRQERGLLAKVFFLFSPPAAIESFFFFQFYLYFFSVGLDGYSLRPVFRLCVRCPSLRPPLSLLFCFFRAFSGRATQGVDYCAPENCSRFFCCVFVDRTFCGLLPR